jgi:putative ABC transport system permease protein
MLRGTQWTVVGTYGSGGGIDENAIAADVDTVLSAFGRTSYQSVEVALNSPADFTKFKDALTTNPQLKVQVKRLGDYYYDQLKPLINLFNFVGFFVGGVMAIGAIFGALTTMYSVVDARVREIATLRALGFSGSAVVLSILIESLALAVPGALIGAALAALFFNDHSVTTSGISFSLVVTPALVGTGIVWALVIGLIGGFMPAIRAARAPVATALRAT